MSVTAASSAGLSLPSYTENLETGELAKRREVSINSSRDCKNVLDWEPDELDELAVNPILLDS